MRPQQPKLVYCPREIYKHPGGTLRIDYVKLPANLASLHFDFEQDGTLAIRSFSRDEKGRCAV